MKLATYKDGSRDGQLVVVSRDLSTAHYATGIAGTLQQVLDDWNFIAPQLQDLSVTLNQGKARHAFPFDPQMCMAPLPRAYQWVTFDSYPHPGREAVDDGGHGSGQQRASDDLRGAADALRLPGPGWAADFGAGVAVVIDDLPAGATAHRALEAVRLLTLYNDAQLVPPGQDDPAGFVPAPTAFAPVVATPDELGDAWQQGRLCLTLQATCNGRRVGMCDAGDMQAPFGALIAGLGRLRRLRAGTLVGAGVVGSMPAADDPLQWPRGHGSLSDRRAAERLRDGRATTAYLTAGDAVRLDMKGRDGQSVFGAIEQTIGLAE